MRSLFVSLISLGMLIPIFTACGHSGNRALATPAPEAAVAPTSSPVPAKTETVTTAPSPFADAESEAIDPEIKAIIAEFVSAQNAHDWEKFTGLWRKGTQRFLDEFFAYPDNEKNRSGYFAIESAEFLSIAHDPGASSGVLTDYELEQYGEFCAFHVQVRYHLAKQFWSYSEGENSLELVLVKEDGAWKVSQDSLMIDWDPDDDYVYEDHSGHADGTVHFEKQITGYYLATEWGDYAHIIIMTMDIQAKHIPADNRGMRIAELDEMSYRRLLWSHRPLRDFWRVGHGYAKKLEEHGLFTMGDIARCSLGKSTDCYNEDLLYRLFGINAELLIDHAWGWEPCTIAEIKAYKPSTNSIGSGQVLQHAYPFDKAKLIVREMTDLLALDLVDKRLLTDQLVLTVGYDIENLTDPGIRNAYHGAITVDHYGRAVPKAAHGAVNLGRQTSSTKLLLDAVTELFERIVDKNLLIRRVNVTANHVVDEATVQKAGSAEQLDLFTDYEAVRAKKEAEEAELARERRMQRAMLEIKKKHGKNAILKGMNLKEGATTVDRNSQIGGHKA